MEFKQFQSYSSSNQVPANSQLPKGCKSHNIFSVCLDVSEKQVIFGGEADGHIVGWKYKRDASKDIKPFIGFSGHKGAVHSLLYHSSMNLLFSGSSDRTIKVWDPWVISKDHSSVQTLIGHGGTVTSLSSYGDCIISASTDCSIKIWKPMAGRQIFLYPWFTLSQTLGDFRSWVNSISLANVLHVADGELYAADSSGSLSVYVPPGAKIQLDSGEVHRVSEEEGFIRVRKHNKAHGLGIHGMVVVSQEHLIITISFDLTMKVFDALTGTLFFTAQNKNRCRFSGLAWNPMAQEVVLVDEGGWVYVWNIFTEKLLKAQDLQRGPLFGVSMRGDRDEIIVTTRYTLEAWKIVRELQYREVAEHQGPVVAITCIEHHAEATEHKILSASLDNTVRVWFPYDMTVKHVFRETKSEISCLHYIKEYDMMFTGNDDGSIRMWTLTAATSRLLHGHTNTVAALASAPIDPKHPDAIYLISAAFDGQVGIWDVVPTAHNVPPHAVSLFHAHHEELLAVAYNSYNHTILTAANDSLIHVWNPVTYQRIATLSGHTHGVTCLAMDANMVLSGSDDETIRVWDSYNNHLLRTLRGQRQPIRSLLILPQGGYVVSCSFHGRILIWDYTTSRILKRIVHVFDLRCLAFNAAKNELLAGTEQSHLVVFPLVPSALVDLVGVAADPNVPDAAVTDDESVAPSSPPANSVSGAAALLRNSGLEPLLTQPNLLAAAPLPSNPSHQRRRSASLASSARAKDVPLPLLPQHSHSSRTRNGAASFLVRSSSAGQAASGPSSLLPTT